MLSSLSLKIGVAALLVALLGISLYGMMHAKQEQARAEVKLEQAVQAHQQAQERLKAAQAIDTRQEGVRRSEGLSVRHSITLAAQAANLKENQDAADPAVADAGPAADGVLLDAIRAALIPLHDACVNLAIQLRQVKQGDSAPATPGRFTAAQIDTQITAVSAAITAATARSEERRVGKECR